MNNQTDKQGSNKAGGHDLLKKHDGSYIVRSFMLAKEYQLPTIEGAAEALEELGVPDGEIDFAIIQMEEFGHNRAHFGVMKGMFLFSEKVDSV